MSIVDVSHQGYNRSRFQRGKYSERRAAAQSYEIFYIMAVTAAFVLLLICTIGTLLFATRNSREPVSDVCHDSPSIIDDEVLAAIHEESVASEVTSVIQISPLQNILRKDWWEDPISEDDVESHAQQRMKEIATMEESSLLIGETVVSYDHKEQLNDYLRNQMESSGIISKKEANAILGMIHLNSSDLVFVHAQTGLFGSLRNSLTLSLCTERSGNIHFMMVILQLEAHLGWKIIGSGERSSWNMAMKASLERRMRIEAGKLLGLPTPDSDALAEEQWA